MRIILSKPVNYIEHLDVTGDVKRFYDILPRIINDMGIDCDIMPVYPGSKKVVREKDTLFLAWHLHDNEPDIWHLKTGYLPDYFYFDKYGYSGWAEIAHKYDYNIDPSSIRDEMQAFCDDYIKNNKSRAVQSEAADVPEEPYILVLQQLTNDSVMEFAHIDYQTLIDEIAEIYKDTKYTVCIKAHPLADTNLCPRGHNPVSISPGVFVATGSIHKIIAGASAVYTVNSGSGFEALLHGKRVFTCGDCDYHWVTNPIKTKEDLQNSIHLIDEPVDKDKILVFLYYMLNEYFVNINNEQSIRRKIDRAITVYTTSQSI